MASVAGTSRGLQVILTGSLDVWPLGKGVSLAHNTLISRKLHLSQFTANAASPGIAWQVTYQRSAVLADACCGLAAGSLAFVIRFDGATGNHGYLLLSLLLPAVWLVVVGVAGGYDARFIGLGTDEFRRVFNAGIFLTAAVAVISYAAKADLARGYVAIALPSLTLSDLLARYALRKRLHRSRRVGRCMRRVVVVGHSAIVRELAAMLRRETYHGLRVVAACVADLGADDLAAVASGAGDGDTEAVPLIAGLDDVVGVVERYSADTVAVLACPEMCGVRLRDLAWQLEKSNTDLCVAPALLDVAGPRTTIRPVAGLPLLHMDHPEFSGIRRLVKAAFDRAVACTALALCGPLMLAIAVAIRLGDGDPALFRQVRVGQHGRPFRVFKFRTMALNAEDRRRDLVGLNEADGLLFKMHSDPRVTRIGVRLRRWSLDELPQLINVAIGEMSLVGPRPALPEEAALYGDHVRRRLAVKPGITGLWQVNGRSDLSWDESVRLDLRYVENWSFLLDLQVLWKTWFAVVRGRGAY
jgi:exopolysaccharide biosynthesis polyprenyl glycosylphosphotransferase